MAVVARGPGKLWVLGNRCVAVNSTNPGQDTLSAFPRIPGRRSPLKENTTVPPGVEREFACSLRGHSGDQLQPPAHVRPNMHPGAAVLDGQAGSRGPLRTLRADDGSGSRLTKIVVGRDPATTTGPVRSVMTTSSMAPDARRLQAVAAAARRRTGSRA